MRDLQASLVLFLVSLPLCLGIAFASQAPLYSGIISGILGALVVPSISRSELLVTGPTAALAAIVATTVMKVGSYEAFAVAVILMGCFQLIFAAVRGGSLGDFLPSSVVKGVIFALGLILVLKQFPHALGYDFDYMGDEAFGELSGHNTISEITSAILEFHPGALVISIISMLILIFWNVSQIPSALIVVICGVALNQGFKSFGLPNFYLGKEHLVSLPVKDLLQTLTVPIWSSFLNPLLWEVGFTLAIVGSFETLVTVDALGKLKRDGKMVSRDRELIGQAVGNIFSGFLCGLPVAGVLIRSSVNVQAGAKSKLSTVLCGVALILCVVMIPKALNLIPLAALATILLFVGIRLASIKVLQEQLSKGGHEFGPFLATVLCILFTDFLTGIVVGLVLGLISVMIRNSRKSITVVSEGNEFLIRLYKDVSFFQKSSLEKILSEIPDGAYVLINGNRNIYIDGDIYELLRNFMEASSERRITVNSNLFEGTK